ncbi:sigma-54-dependent Fis family transcriptional regulator [Kribbella sp. NPDC048928]|uniref:sigma-54-dependent Fis family transcriptional regulator n=1 Tax=Kribbella sp. NPDC048928 TaxID=3364111 RepID=UPI00371BD7E2
MADDWAATMLRARERLLTGGRIEEIEGPSAEILASWRRSTDGGVDARDVTTSYVENVNLASRLARAAGSVVDGVAEDVAGSPVAAVLADSRGRVLLRRSGLGELERRFDSVLLAPGFSYAEHHVGTNGIGSTLEARGAYAVCGHEHFSERLQDFACFGVPVRDPFSHRFVGVLNIATWADRANPALAALVRQAVAVIESRLVELGGQGERLLLDEYLGASRRSGSGVLAISDSVWMSTPELTRVIGSVEHGDTWTMVQDALGRSDAAEAPLTMSDGRETMLRLRAVRRGNELVGALAFPASTTPRPPAPRRPVAGMLPRFVAGTPSMLDAARRVSKHCAHRDPVALIGEPGVGKAALVQAALQLHAAGKIAVVREAVRNAGPDDVDRLIIDVGTALRAGSPVMIKHGERLPADALDRLCGEARAIADAGWLALTVRVAAGDPITPELGTTGIPTVLVPPLRERTEDLPAIVAVLLARQPGTRSVAVTGQLMTRLQHEPWPRNVAEVNDLLAEMLRATDGDKLDISDLPTRFGRGLRRRLTPMEWLERGAIVQALRAAEGRKDVAATSLGISRASIYRKIRLFEIAPDDYI